MTVSIEKSYLHWVAKSRRQVSLGCALIDRDDHGT